MITVTVGNTTHLTPRTGFGDAAITMLHLFEVSEHESLKVAGDIAHTLSSGTATEAMLSTPVSSGGYGHPYGHGSHGSAGPRGAIPNGGDSSVINIQTGQFMEGWEESYGHFIGNTMNNVLFNETEHAELLENTPNNLQVRRPIEYAIEHRLIPIRDRNLDIAKMEVDRL